MPFCVHTCSTRPVTPAFRTRALARQPPAQRARPEPTHRTAADAATAHLQDGNWRHVSSTPGSKFVLIPPSGNPALPALDAVVLVEGSKDASIVRQAISAPVLSIGGVNQGYDKRTVERIQEIARLAPRLIVLADPDPFGRVYRNHLDVLLQGRAQHAFLPVPCAVSTEASKNHSACNVGVEHAHPADVARALSQPHTSAYGSAAAAAFSADDLQAWGLTKPFENQNDPAAPKNVAIRRELFCNSCGIARSDGKQLLRALNGYNFERQQVERQLQYVERRVPHVAALQLALGSTHQRDVLKGSADVLAYALQRAVRRALWDRELSSKRDAVLRHADLLLRDWGYTDTKAILAAVEPLLANTVAVTARRLTA